MNELSRPTPESYKYELCVPTCSIPGCVSSLKCRYRGEQTDFYVVRLETLYDEPINTLVPAPVGQKCMLFRRGSTIWQRRDDFNSFVRGEFGQGGVPW